MKRHFENIDVECWEERSRLGTARPAICLFHAERTLGPEILAALDELATEAPVAKRTLTLKPSSRKHAIETLRLRLALQHPGLRVMSVTRDSTSATIELTMVGLGLVRHAVKAWLDGGEDFCVSPEPTDIKKRELGELDRASLDLWFWGPTMEP